MVKEAMSAATGLLDQIKQNGLAVVLTIVLLTQSLWNSYTMSESHTALQAEVRGVLLEQLKASTEQIAKNNSALAENAQAVKEAGSATRDMIEAVNNLKLAIQSSNEAAKTLLKVAPADVLNEVRELKEEIRGR